MAIPDTKEGLERAGWLYDSDGVCRGCHEHIEWWITPRGKKSPMSLREIRKDDNLMNPVERVIRVSHFQVCPNAEDFRKPKR